MVTKQVRTQGLPNKRACWLHIAMIKPSNVSLPTGHTKCATMVSKCLENIGVHSIVDVRNDGSASTGYLDRLVHFSAPVLGDKALTRETQLLRCRGHGPVQSYQIHDEMPRHPEMNHHSELANSSSRQYSFISSRTFGSVPALRASRKSASSVVGQVMAARSAGWPELSMLYCNACRSCSAASMRLAWLSTDSLGVG